MKKFAALLVAFALVSPAYAQKLNPAFAPKTTFQGTHPRPKVATVSPASKPVLLHTGKPITQDQKQQLMLSVTRATAPKIPAGAMRVQTPILAAANLLTPDQLYLNGVYIDALGARVNQFDGVLSFTPGGASYLILNITVKPSTAYTILMKVNIDGYVITSPNIPGGINISTSSALNQGTGVNAPQTFNTSKGENEFAYSFVANSAGNLQVYINSTDSFWSFESCEISSAAF